jgi:pimeloyl-ACP methyl ester carboxylesterase
MPIAADLNYFVHEAEHTTRPPLILIHGAGGFHLSWPPHIRRLRDHTVYALDLNGHGASIGDGRVTVDDHVQDVLKFMDELGLQSACLAGHSMGGGIALTMAVHHAGRVDGLLLVSTGAKLRVAEALLDAASRVDTFSKAVEMVIENSFSKHVDLRVKGLTKQRMALTNPQTLRADLLACHSFDILGSLPDISAPTLILCGSEDAMTPSKYSQTLCDQVPGARFELIPHAGHMLMLEKPEVVRKLMDEFLGSLE